MPLISIRKHYITTNHTIASFRELAIVRKIRFEGDSDQSVGFKLPYSTRDKDVEDSNDRYGQEHSGKIEEDAATHDDRDQPTKDLHERCRAGSHRAPG